MLLGVVLTLPDLLNADVVSMPFSLTIHDLLVKWVYETHAK